MTRMSRFESLFVNSYFDYLLHRVTGLEKLITIAVKDVPGRILEVGCGAGITTGILAKRFPGSEIVAVDVDESQIARARRRLSSERVLFMKRDATELQFPAASFDACFASYAFHHIPAFPKALNEIHRVLRPGAALYVLEVPFSKEIIRQLRRKTRLTAIRKPAGSSDFFTRNKLLTEIERSGYKVQIEKGLIHVYLGCERI